MVLKKAGAFKFCHFFFLEEATLTMSAHKLNIIVVLPDSCCSAVHDTVAGCVSHGDLKLFSSPMLQAMRTYLRVGASSPYFSIHVLSHWR